MKETAGANPDSSPDSPFDDYQERGTKGGAAGECKAPLHPARQALRMLCAISLGLAIISVVVMLGLDSIHYFGSHALEWRLKSAFPLIFIGLSFGCLQFVRPRPWKERLLSLAVSVAFVLWGAEQFVPNAQIALLMDDVVVFLFVMDLGIVILGRRAGG